jgi:hypothetical protein
MAAYFGQFEKPVGDRHIARSDPQLAKWPRLRHTHSGQTIRGSEKRVGEGRVGEGAFGGQRAAANLSVGHNQRLEMK